MPDSRRHDCAGAALVGRSRLVGDPVDLVNGVVYDHDTDFRIATEHVQFAWVRRYDGGTTDEQRGIGRGMRHPLDYALAFDVDGLTLTTPEGDETCFRFLAQAGESDRAGGLTLTMLDGARYLVRGRDGFELTFTFADAIEPARLVGANLHGTALTLGYDKHGQLAQLMFADGTTLRVQLESGRIRQVDAFDAQGRAHGLVRYHYDEHGRLVRLDDAYGHSQQFAWDAAHRLVKKTDRRGYSFLYTYDHEGRCVRSGGEDGAELVELAYNPTERTSAVKRADGGVTQYFYDASETIVAVLDPCGGSETYRTDASGRVSEEYDAHGNLTRIVYDADGEPVAKVDPFGHVRGLDDNDQAPDPRAHWVGESALEWALGRRHAAPERLPITGDLLSRVPLAARELVQTSALAWGGKPKRIRNLQGLPIRDEREDGSVRRFGFDPNANLRVVVDFDGQRTDYTYVSDNHLATVKDALGRVLRFEHSPYEKLTAFTDAGGTRSEYGYDALDRLVEVRRHGKLRERYRYDAAGNLVEKQSGDGKVLFQATYGAKNLEQSRRWADGRAELFAYDDAGCMRKAEGPAGVCAFQYGPDSVRTRDMRDGLGVQHALSFRGLLATTVLERFTTTYRELDAHTTEVRDPSGAVYRLERVAEGVYVTEQPSGLSELTQYDVEGRCRLKVLYESTTGFAHSQRVFRYSGEGDLVAIEDPKAGTTAIDNDAAHRLSRIRYASGRVAHYAYDEGDNLVRLPALNAETGELEDAAFPFSVQSGNRVYLAAGERFSYDQRDHVSAREGIDGTRVYERDAADQLVCITFQGEIEFATTYDPLGRRVSKTTRAGTWTYYWDSDRLAAEVFPDGRLRVYVYTALEALVPLGFVDYASLDAGPASGKSYAFTTNHLGTIERVYTEARVPSERLVWSAWNEPYGLALATVGARFHQPLRMPGHYWDSETGLHYNRFRYYDPRIGLYLESDPLGIEGGANLYAYTGNPWREVDVRGEIFKCPNGLACRMWRGLATIFGRRLSEGTAPKLPLAQTPPKNTPPRLVVSTGLGRDVDVLVGMSPLLSAQVTRLKDVHFTIRYSASDDGPGSFCQKTKKLIVIDSAYRSHPTVVAQVLAHEAGHAEYKSAPYVAPHTLTRDQYISYNTQRHLDDEGAATLNNAKVRDEIIASGGPDVGIAGSQARTYDEIYRDHQQRNISEYMARRRIGEVFADREVTSSSGRTYREHYGEPYEKAWSSTYPEQDSGPTTA